jgi:hypothetical protein
MITAIVYVPAASSREPWSTAQRPARVRTRVLGSADSAAPGCRSRAASRWTSTGGPQRAGSGCPSSSNHRSPAGGRRDEGAIRRHQDEPPGIRDRRVLDTRSEEACADPLRQMRSQPPHEARLLSRERSAHPPVQADETTTGAAHPEDGAQLVAETERPEDVAVARARVDVTPRRFDVGAHVAYWISRQRRPLVDVVVEELVVDELRESVGRDLLLVRLREQKRRGIDRRPEGRRSIRRSTPLLPS